MRASFVLVAILAAFLANLSPTFTAAESAAESTIERPVPFAADVNALTPEMAAHWGLAAPEWPVSGTWSDARLYRADSGSVLVVTRKDGVLERFPLDDGALTALQAAIDRGIVASGTPLPPATSAEAQENANGRFVRNQLLLGALVYGPSATLLAGDDNEEAAVALYLATTGATILSAAMIANKQPITKPQSHLSTDGGWKGAAAGAGIAYAARLDTGEDDVAYGAAMLAGGLAGSALGYTLGRPLTIGEAHSASFGSTFSAALSAGIAGIAGGYQHSPHTTEVAAIVAGGSLGYPAGLWYARHASYSITAGDTGALTAASAIGVVAAIPFVANLEDSPNAHKAAAAIFTTGLLAGTFLGDRFLVRPYDHTETEGWLVGIGAVAGGLIGAAIPLLADSYEDENTAAIAGAGAGGAALGMWLTEWMIGPKPGARRSSGR